VNRLPHTAGPSGEAGPNRRGPEAAASEAVSAPWRVPHPPWLRPTDLAALAQRFPPLEPGQVRQLALAFHQGSTPVEILLLGLTGAGLAPAAAQQLIADLRLLRDRRSQATTPSTTTASGTAVLP
jgi:hypothetical protein